MKRTNSSCNSPVRLTYAVRVMIHLATLPAHERASLPALAGGHGSSGKLSLKVLASLVEGPADYVAARSGGRFEILPAAAGFNAQVIEAIDGPIHLNVCSSRHGLAADREVCPAHLLG